MKTRLLCAFVIALVLAAACTELPTSTSTFNKDSRTPLTAGHYSLVYTNDPDVPLLILPVTGSTEVRSSLQGSQPQTCTYHRRFSRSLFRVCSENSE